MNFEHHFVEMFVINYAKIVSDTISLDIEVM